jgi:uncharacterized membrane protein
MELKTSHSLSALNPLHLKKNVSPIERIIMAVSGAYLLYDGLSHNKKSISKSTLGGTMLLRGVSGYCPVYDAVDNLQHSKAVNVNIRINSVIKKPVNEVYEFWRDLENLPKFMTHLESVKTINQRKSEWTAKGPAGIGRLTWEAEIVKDEKNTFLSWQSLADAPIKNVGKVVFKPKGKHTEIDVTISYHAPFGVVGEKAAQLLNPYFEKIVKDDITSFKSYLELEK